MTKTDRQLAAIMMLDVVGYSRLMGQDEEGTLTLMKRLRQTVVLPQLAAYRGRLVKVMGDGAIILFASVIDAVNAAVAIQPKYHIWPAKASSAKDAAKRALPDCAAQIATARRAA